MEPNKSRCTECDEELTDKNWYPSWRNTNRFMCKTCHGILRRALHHDPKSIASRKALIGETQKSSDPCRNVGNFLGVNVAEEVLSRVFKDVQRMPYGHPFDLICNKDKLVDVKAASRRNGVNSSWFFNIYKNSIPDYFACLAFDNVDSLNLLHFWLIPGEKVNNKTGFSVVENDLDSWAEFEKPIDELLKCCNVLSRRKKWA